MNDPSPTPGCFFSNASPEEWMLVINQLRQARVPPHEMTCPCGELKHWVFLFRCLYCGIWYCQPCAEKHFGMTRDQWFEEQVRDKAIQSLYLI